MTRKIIQIATAAAAGWNGQTHYEDTAFSDRDALYALADDGSVWRLRGDASEAYDKTPWIRLPSLPTEPASPTGAVEVPSSSSG